MVAILLDKRNWEKIVCLLLAFFVFLIVPGAAVAAFFSRDDIDFSMPGLADEIIVNLTPEEISELQFVEDTVNALHTAMSGRTPEQIKAAEVLFILALSKYAKEPGFVAKLTGCFADGQTDEQLIAAVNTAFGTSLDPDDFSAIMNYANHQLVEVAKSQLGNVGGEPYWSWYGFPDRVEWCACFVSWCANECGYLDKGIIPRFSGCDTGMASLESSQERMKAVNAYYRKHKTLDGCPDISEDVVHKLKSGMASSWHYEDKPYPSWALANNNAEIRRVKERITSLTRQRELGYTGWEFAGGRVEANTADNRLQIFFEEKPDGKTRSSMKSNGFRWAPSAGAWQRQLNDNAIYAADWIACIRPLTGESPSELQKRVRMERQADAGGFEPVSEESSQEEPDQDNGMCMG